MSFNLIPFGYHVSSGDFLDVSDVANGKNNGCVCPSCDTPLIARQGEENDWHFAHASRKVYEQTSQECEYSFFVSVRMMVRQLIGNNLLINLPQYKSQLVAPLSFGDKKIKIPFEVTRKNQITITDINVEKQFDEVVFDFIGNVGSFKFMIFLSHEGRELPYRMAEKAHSNVGIIEISLMGIGKLFFHQEKQQTIYKTILLEYIQNDLDSKKWIDHPRYDKAKAEAELKLNEFKQQFLINGVVHDEDIHQFLTPQEKPKHTHFINEKYPSFKCKQCKTIWRNSQSNLKDKQICPVCAHR